MKRRLAVLVATVLASGCFRFSQPAPELHEYRLDYPAPQLSMAPLPVVLSIAPLTVTAAYDRETIVFRTDPYSFGRYFYHRWATNPGLMISDLLARDFTQSGLLRGVQQGPTPVGSDYRLSGIVEEIEHRIGKDGCEAQLDVRLLLVRLRRAGTEPILLQQRFAGTEPCSCADPGEVAAAMSRVMERLAEELLREVHRLISADRGQNNSPDPGAPPRSQTP
jgi:ABC-type uncharacterized transport system auxiliary subunit